MWAYKAVIEIKKEGKLAEVFSPLFITRWSINGNGFFFIYGKIHCFKALEMTEWYGKNYITWYKNAVVEQVWLSGRIEVRTDGYIAEKATLFKKRETNLPDFDDLVLRPFEGSFKPSSLDVMRIIKSYDKKES